MIHLGQMLYLGPKLLLAFGAVIIMMLTAIILAIRRKSGWSWLLLMSGWFLIAYIEFGLVEFVHAEFMAPPGTWHSFPHWVWTFDAFRIHQTGLLLSIPTVLINGLRNQDKTIRIAALIASASLILMSIMLYVGWKVVNIL